MCLCKIIPRNIILEGLFRKVSLFVVYVLHSFFYKNTQFFAEPQYSQFFAILSLGIFLNHS